MPELTTKDFKAILDDWKRYINQTSEDLKNGQHKAWRIGDETIFLTPDVLKVVGIVLNHIDETITTIKEEL